MRSGKLRLNTSKGLGIKMEREIILSYGGGRQTIAILVLIAQGKLPKPKLAIMADTGRERQATFDYLDNYAKPLMNDLGMEFVLAGHEYAKVDLYGSKGELLIPAYTQTGKLPTFCSSEWKKLVVRRKLRELGYGPDRPVINWLGYSLDEVHRAKHSDKKWIENHWPLLFDVKLRLHECILLIEDFGLPEPPKSSCWCCPHLKNPQLQEIKYLYPTDWKKAVKLDYLIRQNDKQGGVFLHEQRVPLDEADLTVNEEITLFECADVCWT